MDAALAEIEYVREKLLWQRTPGQMKDWLRILDRSLAKLKKAREDTPVEKAETKPSEIEELHKLLCVTFIEADRAARISNLMLQELKKKEHLNVNYFIKLPSTTAQVQQKLLKSLTLMETLLPPKPKLAEATTKPVIPSCWAIDEEDLYA